MGIAEIHNSTKIHIAQCALHLFVQKGYHQTSIPDIVADCGHSTGAVYHHFESKESLARFIHHLASGLFMEKYHEKVEPAETCREKIFAFVRMMFEWDDSDPVIVKYLITDRPTEVLNRKTTVCSAEGMQCVGNIISHGLSTQEISTDNYFVGISLISGTIIHFINLKKDGYIAGKLGDRADEVAAHIFNGLKRWD